MLSTTASLLQGGFFLIIGAFFLRGVPRIVERGIEKGTFQPGYRQYVRWFRWVGWAEVAAGVILILSTLIFDILLKR